MPHHLLNLALLLQIIQRLPRQTAVDLQAIDERGDGDEAVGLDVLVEFVGGGFVEDDGVVGLVLDCVRESKMSVVLAAAVVVVVEKDRTFALGPLLLLLFAGGRCCRRLCWMSASGFASMTLIRLTMIARDV